MIFIAKPKKCVKYTCTCRYCIVGGCREQIFTFFVIKQHLLKF